MTDIEREGLEIGIRLMAVPQDKLPIHLGALIAVMEARFGRDHAKRLILKLVKDALS
jgi:hypothetical protein